MIIISTCKRAMVWILLHIQPSSSQCPGRSLAVPSQHDDDDYDDDNHDNVSFWASLIWEAWETQEAYETQVDHDDGQFFRAMEWLMFFFGHH